MASAGTGDRVEGLHAVEAAVANGRVLELWVERRRLGHSRVASLVARARVEGVSVHEVEEVGSRAETAAPQGLVGRARPLRKFSLEEVVAALSPAAVIVVDHVEDPHNLGAIARSAEAAGMGGLVMPARRGSPLGPAAFKAAAGALDRIPVSVVGSVAAGLAELARLGLWTVGLAPDATTSLFGLPLLSEPLAIVVGSEGRGLSDLVRRRVEVVASIPLMGRSESLNASVAAALACYEVARVRGLTPPLS